MNTKPILALVLYPGCIFFEAALALELLKGHFRVLALTPDGKDHPADLGLKFGSCQSFSDFLNEWTSSHLDVRAFLIPGGDPESLTANSDIDQILQKAARESCVLAAICAGPFVLAKAGVLRGRAIAHGYQAEQLAFLAKAFEDVRLTDEAVLHDGPVLTAKAWAHVDFAVELAVKLGAIEGRKAPSVKNYYKGFPEGKMRPLALAILRNALGEFLFHEGHDSIKDELFYRPLGGGIEFGETAADAVVREIREELGLEIQLGPPAGFFENLFVYEGRRGHELIVVTQAIFKDPQVAEKESLDILESGQIIGRAVWRSVEQIKQQGAKIFPVGLEDILKKLSTNLPEQV